jgi:hypothetical protein
MSAFGQEPQLHDCGQFELLPHSEVPANVGKIAGYSSRGDNDALFGFLSAPDRVVDMAVIQDGDEFGRHEQCRNTWPIPTSMPLGLRYPLRIGDLLLICFFAGSMAMIDDPGDRSDFLAYGLWWIVGSLLVLGATLRIAYVPYGQRWRHLKTVRGLPAMLLWLIARWTLIAGAASQLSDLVGWGLWNDDPELTDELGIRISIVLAIVFWLLFHLLASTRSGRALGEKVTALSED